MGNRRSPTHPLSLSPGKGWTTDRSDTPGFRLTLKGKGRGGRTDILSVREVMRGEGESPGDPETVRIPLCLEHRGRTCDRRGRLRSSLNVSIMEAKPGKAA